MPKSINPASGKTVEEFADHGEDDVKRALDNAGRAYRSWRLTPFSERSAMMNRAADLLERDVDKYAELATLEMGKRLAEAKAEVKKCASVCRYYAENAEKFLADETRESDAETTFVSYQPIGIVLAVMPWNFPFWQLFRFAAPNLMAGNVGILKHASNVPQCALAIEEVFTEAGAPQGVFQTLLIGSDKVNAIIEDPRVRAVTLTGSEPAGAAVSSHAAEHIKKAVLELGGSDAFVIMPSADIDEAIQTGIKARNQNNGQSCIAAKRFIVHEDVYDRVLDGFKSAYEAIKLGDPMEDGTDLGPLATEDIRDELADQVERAVEKGATLVTGGKKPSMDGWFYEPTILADIPRENPAYQEEFFGPCAMFFKVKDVNEAVEIANATRFGLSSSIWTKDAEEQKTFIRDSDAGGVFVNRMTASDPRIPFGGTKASGFGRELSAEGIREFVNVKTVALDSSAL